MDKNEALAKLIKDCEKRFGAGSLMYGSKTLPPMPRKSSGSLNLDLILGGGWPEGKVFEVYGPESSGKTSIALMSIAAMQKEGITCAFIDAEQALDPVWARKLGVNFDELLFAQPSSGEEALNMVEELASSGLIGFIVIDSVAALVPQAELDGEMGDQNIGLLARLMSKATRKLVAVANQSKCSILFINQVREKIGVMFGNPETTTGGRALKFYTSIRLETRKELIKQGTDIVGQKIKIKTVKNKTYPPLKSTDVTLMYDSGFDINRETFQLAVRFEFIEKSGSWYSYNGNKLGQGEDNALRNLLADEKVFDEVKNKVLECMNAIGADVPQEEVDLDEFEDFEE